MIKTQLQKWGCCLCSPAVLVTFIPQSNHPQNYKAQVILPTSHTIDAAFDTTISQVSEENSLYIIIIVVIIITYL